MPLFSICSQCGRKSLYLELDECGICRNCRKENALSAVSREKMAPSREVDVSQLVKHESADYEPPEAPGGPVSVFIDVETTGLDPHQDAIIQVSAIRFFGDKGVDGLNTYINPLRPIPIRSMQVHGITDEMVQDAPVIADIKDQFMALIKGAVLVGYNVTFDLNFLNNAFDGALDGVPYVDVLAASKNILDLPNYRLETVANHLDFQPEGGFHDSLSDCMATAAVFFRLGLQGLLESPRTFTPATPSSPSQRKRPPYNTACTPKKTIQPVIPVDTSHPLFGKTIVFTGELSISRDDASQIAENVGAIVRGSVSCKTEYLVVGRQDKSIVGADGMSNKEEKAYALNESGKSHIEIINESQFLALINGGKKNGTDNP